MESSEFRVKAKELVDYIADYHSNIGTLRVTPNVEPGYLRNILPQSAPKQGEDWDSIMKDFKESILTGVTHWQHPQFHAYFPAGNSYPSIMGEMLSAGLGVLGFSWASSPACTELETIVLNWLGKMIGLSRKFLPLPDDASLESDEENNSDSNSESEGEPSSSEQSDHLGGGVILGSASECVLVALLSARVDMLSRLKEENPESSDSINLSKLIMYTSKLGHSCIEKAAMIGMVQIRQLETDENFSLRGNVLESAIKEDRKKGLVPFFTACTLGTTAVCSFDNLVEIGTLCNREKIHLHVDAAYAGSAFICEEFRIYAKGLELVDSFNFNPNKWMLMNFDCSCMWVKDKFKLTKALSVDPIYLRYREMDKTIDYRHWGISLSRRFRSLKIWFTLRSYGIEGLQKYIREHVRLAKVFEEYVKADNRFEIVGHVTLGLVCFRVKGPNSISQNLLYILNDSGQIHMVPAMLNNKYAIRFCVCKEKTTEEDIKKTWDHIVNVMTPGLLELSQSAVTKQKRLFFAMSNMSKSEASCSDSNNNTVEPVQEAEDSEKQERIGPLREIRTIPKNQKVFARMCSVIDEIDEYDK